MDYFTFIGRYWYSKYLQVCKYAYHLYDLWDPKFEIKLHSNSANIPRKGSKHAVGYDLYASEQTTIPPWGRAIVSTDVSIRMYNSPHVYARIAPRSGLSINHGIHVGAGVVDSDYSGKIGVVVFNLSNEEFVVAVNDRIAQLIFERVLHPQLGTDDEFESVRGVQGFGSTGR